MLLKASVTKTVSAFLKQEMDASVRDKVWCAPEASFLGLHSLLLFVATHYYTLKQKSEENGKAVAHSYCYKLLVT